MKNTKWNFKKINNAEIAKNNELPLDKDILSILYSRNISNKKDIIEFLNPSLSNIQDHYLLKDLKKAVDIISNAMKNNKNIWIYGDYDVDGITSTSLLYLTFKKLGYDSINYYIPIRDEGYGLNKNAIEQIKNSGGDLIITVDCGITSFEEIDFANSLKLPVIITDHHEINKKLPKASAIVNPKREDNEFSFKFLAGVGTAFLLAAGLFEEAGRKDEVYGFLDLVAIGTVADIVPLVRENRIFVKFGLEQLLHTEITGLKYLCSLIFDPGKKEFTTYDIGFILAPVFNAAGRLKDAKMVVKLLTTENKREIEIISKELISKNNERKVLQEKIIADVEENIQKNSLNENYVIVDYSPEYHHGVIGIVASKIIDTYYKPTVIMEVKEDEEIAVASARSIEGFNLIEALQTMPELFLKFGGHAGAAGFTIPVKNIKSFVKKINDYAKKKLDENDFVKLINIDKEIPIQKVSYEFYQIIDLLKPFGFGNPNPTFAVKNIILENIKHIGQNKNHLMFDIKKNGFTSRNAVWFGAGDNFKDLNQNIFYDLAFKLKVEDYMGKSYTKVYVDDIKNSELNNDRYSYFYSLYNTIFPLKSIFYTNIELNPDIPLTPKMDFEQISLFQGSKFVGRLDYNISNMLTQLIKFYNYTFKIQIEGIQKTDIHYTVDILIKRNYDFLSYAYNEKRLFIDIKNFILGNMEYDSFTKAVLAAFFKSEKNLIIPNDKTYNFRNAFLTFGIYFMKKNNLKSQIVTSSKSLQFSDTFLRNYYDVNKDYQEGYPFTVFFNTVPETEINERNIVISDNYENENYEKIDFEFIIPENVIIKTPKEIMKLENEKNIFFEFIPLKEKLKIKKLLENGEKIYSDKSIYEIL